MRHITAGTREPIGPQSAPGCTWFGGLRLTRGWARAQASRSSVSAGQVTAMTHMGWARTVSVMVVETAPDQCLVTGDPDCAQLAAGNRGRGRVGSGGPETTCRSPRRPLQSDAGPRHGRRRPGPCAAVAKLTVDCRFDRDRARSRPLPRNLRCASVHGLCAGRFHLTVGLTSPSPSQIAAEKDVGSDRRDSSRRLQDTKPTPSRGKSRPALDYVLSPVSVHIRGVTAAEWHITCF